MTTACIIAAVIAIAFGIVLRSIAHTPCIEVDEDGEEIAGDRQSGRLVGSVKGVASHETYVAAREGAVCVE